MSDLSSYDTFTLQELEYLAENEMITIIPKTVVKSQLSLLSVRTVSAAFARQLHSHRHLAPFFVFALHIAIGR